MTKSKKKSRSSSCTKQPEEELSCSIPEDRLLPYLLSSASSSASISISTITCTNTTTSDQTNSNDDSKNNTNNPSNDHLPQTQSTSNFSSKNKNLPIHLQHVPNDILTKGYSIIPSILSKGECENAIDQLWDFVQDTSGNMVSRKDPLSWYPKRQIRNLNVDSELLVEDQKNGHDGNNCSYHDDDGGDDDDPWPHTGYSSFPDMFQSLGSGFLLGQTRLHITERIFEPLLGTKDLHVSKEGFTFARPSQFSIPAEPSSSSPYNKNIHDDENDKEQILHHYQWDKPKEMTTRRVCGKEQKHSIGEHYDQPNHIKGLQTLQSSICFIDQKKECGDGHFACIPYSHSNVHGKMTKDIYRGKFSWVPLMEDEISSLCQEDDKMEVEHVYVNAGDVIVWRSDLIHAAVPSESTSPNFRAVGYVSLSPAQWTPNYPNVWNEKINAYKWGKTGDHRSYLESWHDHKRCSGTSSSSNSNWIMKRQRPYYRYSPPKVTRRLAELYGLLPSNLSTEKEYQKAIDRATIRGVRFVDDDLNNHSIKHLNSSPDQPLCTAYSQQLTLANNELLFGQDKYLGGVCSPDGSFVYGVPGHAKRVLRVNTQTNEMDLIGPVFPGEFKWLRGVDIPPQVMKGKEDEYPLGCCIALPSNQRSILKINCKTHEVSTFGETVESGWLYHGGNLTADGYVYAIPANATRVLKIDPTNETIECIGPTFEGLQKWFGGILGSDGCVYGIPQNASKVLKINPFTQECTVIGDDLGDGMWKWHGGTSINDGKQIIGFPNNADSVLVIDVENQNVFTVGDERILQSGRHRIPQDGRYKWLGGAVTLNGRYSYLFPCDSERVLRIDNETLNLALIGPELLEGENKYQNGFVSKDGCVYGIPQRSAGVLRIIPGYLRGDGVDDEDQVDVLYCGDEMVHLKDKFEGGVIDPDGNIYCIPLRAKTLMKVIPTEDISK